MSNRKVGLVMIVRDEAHVITRCLESVAPYIDYYTIVDTGSTDNTIEVIENFFAECGFIPGEVYKSKWKDFATNRTHALILGRTEAEYSLIIDADATLEFPKRFSWPELTEDAYSLQMYVGTFAYWRAQLVANRLDWRYVGVLHEYLEADGANYPVQLPGPKFIEHADGGRSKGLSAFDKYTRDANILLDALAKEPDNARYRFYLAQSYANAGMHEPAIEAYQVRIDMGGFDQEVFEAYLGKARAQEAMGFDIKTITQTYLDAFNYRPIRAEPLCALARIYRLRGQFSIAKMFADQALSIPKPNDVLFVDESVYEYRAKDEFAISCFYTGQFYLSAFYSKDILDNVQLSESERARIIVNYQFANNAVGRENA